MCNKILTLCNDWEASGVISGDKVSCYIYKKKAHCLTSIAPIDSNEYYKEAIDYYKKALKKCTKDDQWEILGKISSCYYVLEYKDLAIQYIKDAIDARYAVIKKNLANAIEGKVDDPLIGSMYWQYALLLEEVGDYSQRDFYIKLSAKCGDREAIDFCFRNNINYTK